MSVPAGGAEPTVLTRPDTASGEGDHLYPSALPNGRGVLFTIAARSASQLDNAQIAVFDAKTRQTRILVRGGSQAEYVETGHLVYAAAGFLRAVRFDLAQLEVTSDPVPVAEQVQMSVPGTANYAVSRNGTLVYVPGGLTGVEAPRSLVWVDRQGREQPLKAPARAYISPRLSPDGTRIALQVGDQERDIWVWNGDTLTRLTFDPAIEQLPVWTPDSRRIIFNSQRGGVFNLFWHAADGTGADERLTTNSNPQNPFSITPDGRYVLVGEVMPKTGPDVAQVELNAASIANGKAETKPLVQTNFAEFGPDISPDGRWIAYQSSESGGFQIYVRPYPNVDNSRWQVSPDGGSRPLWAKTGRELFYVDSYGALMTVGVQTSGSTFVSGNPTRLFDAKYYHAFFARSYDVSADGQRFLMIKDATPAPQTSTPSGLVVVLNWFEELKARIPAK